MNATRPTLRVRSSYLRRITIRAKLRELARIAFISLLEGVGLGALLWITLVVLPNVM